MSVACVLVLLGCVLAKPMQVPWHADNAPAVEPPFRYAIVHKDFVRDFDSTLVTNSLTAEASQCEKSGKIEMPGIFLHTMPQGDAIAPYPNVAIPPADPNVQTFLVFNAGMRDGIPWETKAGTPNGVRFLIAVDGKVVFSVDRAGEGWWPCAVDMMPWAGQTVTVELRTNAIDGNTSYDWAVFGQPLLIGVDTRNSTPIPADSVGMALAEVVCQKPSTVVLTVGADTERVDFEAGTWWVPMKFRTYSEPQAQIEKGDALVKRWCASPYAPQFASPQLELSSPLVVAGTPFDLLVNIRNEGMGTYTGTDLLQLGEGLGERFGQVAMESRPIGRLAPGEARTLRWNSLISTSPGDYSLTVVLQRPWSTISFRVFDREPSLPPEHPDGAYAVATPDTPLLPHQGGNSFLAAHVGNAWSRILIVCGGSDACGIAQTWTGSEWRRTGSLYPLGTVRVRMADGTDVDVPCPVTSIDAANNVLTLRAKNDAGETVWMFTPDASQPRIHMHTTFTAAADANLLAFCGPTCLIGDRAGGNVKDFAIFPGLEYLEGSEESSSERDLAPPLNDRRVPLAYKIATPLIGVQAADSLMALLWDENQEWTAGERLPAARFLAPKPDSGLGYIHASIFAPSVGKYVKENEYDARKQPYPLKAGQVVQLDSWLVLDHKARYPKDHVVNGPHRGGLVLQAIQHWFDVYGNGEPAPSPQPRPWDIERALCRDAYLHAVWSENPPGWSHCAGWKPGPMVGYIVPLTLDLRAGVPDDDRKEVQRRIDTVFDRILKEQGKHYFWSNAGAHTMLGELPFYAGYLADSMRDFRQQGFGLLAQRTAGQWVWQPGEEKLSKLGHPGDSTLAQAAQPSYVALRAARMTGSPELAKEALAAMKQMEQYEVPRGAQTWECPLYQPDILAAAQAIRAYCEAYRLTGDAAYLEHARYWAWTGLPFLYLWTLDGYPTMKYNVISVIGSTFYTHSWIGLPVVWCGLVYAYAIQDLAEFDTSFDWRRVAQGITNSAMWQQYAEGPSKGTYPDSWSMAKNKPNPSDINPENILVNEFRLRGQTPEIRFARLERAGQRVFINSAADIADAQVVAETSAIRFSLKLPVTATVYTLVAPVDEPKAVTGAGERVADSDALQTREMGWLYDADLKGVVFKRSVGASPSSCGLQW